MKNKILFSVLIAVIPVLLFSQQDASVQKAQLIHYNSNISKPLTTIEKSFINEVYADQANRYVYDNPNRIKEIKDILRNRVIVEELEGKDLSSITKLSSVRILDEFNHSINRSVNVQNFNPLKYHFNFYERENTIHYRVDNTQYIITILPITIKK